MIDEKKLIEEIQDHIEKEKAKCNQMVELGLKGSVVKYNHGEYCYVNALHLVQSQPKVGEWIPVSERLPEISEPVLVFTDSHTQEIWSLIKDEDGDYWEDDYGYGQLIRDAIAWMPLPEPYRKDVE